MIYDNDTGSSLFQTFDTENTTEHLRLLRYFCWNMEFQKYSESLE